MANTQRFLDASYDPETCTDATSKADHMRGCECVALVLIQRDAASYGYAHTHCRAKHPRPSSHRSDSSQHSLSKRSCPRSPSSWPSSAECAGGRSSWRSRRGMTTGAMCARHAALWNSTTPRWCSPPPSQGSPANSLAAGNYVQVLLTGMHARGVLCVRVAPGACVSARARRHTNIN